MLYNLTGSAILAAGLDPHLGMLHADDYNKPTFTFDLIEVFRPWIDSWLIEQCLEHELTDSCFQIKGDAWFLNKKGKALLIPLFNERMRANREFNGRNLSGKNHIYRFAGEFAQHLLKTPWETSP